MGDAEVERVADHILEAGIGSPCFIADQFRDVLLELHPGAKVGITLLRR